MADKKYPKMPIKNWCLLRQQLKRKMTSTISLNYLATLLNITERSAKNILPQFSSVGLLNEDNSVSDMANLWRDDTEYPKVCKKMRIEIYPDELLQLAPDPIKDYDSAVRWFMRDSSVGEATAKQMATFYQLLVKADPADGSDVKATQKNVQATKGKSKAEVKKNPKSQEKSNIGKEKNNPQDNDFRVSPNININVQIHIDANATTSQIEEIFSSMFKHFNMIKNTDE